MQNDHELVIAIIYYFSPAREPIYRRSIFHNPRDEETPPGPCGSLAARPVLRRRPEASCFINIYSGRCEPARDIHRGGVCLGVAVRYTVFLRGPRLRRLPGLSSQPSLSPHRGR